MALNQEERWLLQEKYEGKESEAFLADLERLQAGEPLAYVIGHVPFLGCRIYLDSRPLIPRPETEFWVEKAVEEIKKKGSVRVLDLCAGSGCIGVAVAKHCPEASVVFAEIDHSHLSTIQKNISINISTGQERCEIVQSNLFENLNGTFDFILSNPPYIDPKLDRTEKSVKDFEPHLALYGGEEGLEVVNQMIGQASKYLNPGGELWIEHEPEQVEKVRRAAKDRGLEIFTYKDQYFIKRFSVLTVKTVTLIAALLF